MNRNSRHDKNLTLAGIAIFSVAISLAGCGSSMIGSTGDFRSNGLPKQKYLVGGGLDVEWVAPQAGTAYLVEENTHKIIMTKSLEADEEFEFSPGSAEPEEAKQIFGVEMSKLKFLLYFIPAEQTVPQ
ncbi:MAG: hypothetical protein P8016_05540 [Sedimentisphaerales bacterium]|jgi:hypothetical protein